MNYRNCHVRMEHKVVVGRVARRPRPVVARRLGEAQRVQAAVGAVAIAAAMVRQRDCRLQRNVECAAVRRLSQR